MRPLVPVLLVALVACGGDDDDTSTGGSDRTTTSTSTTTTTSVAEETTSTTAGGGGSGMQATMLTVDVTSDGTNPLRAGTLSCGDTSSGTGFLADPAAAQAACDLLTDNAEAVRRIVDGPDPDRICTMQYGGPEVAKVTGTLEGKAIDATINRVDGCAIADWDTLEPLIGPPNA